MQPRKLISLVATWLLTVAFNITAVQAQNGSYDTEITTIDQYNKNLAHMRKHFQQLHQRMPRLHVVEARVVSKSASGASFAAYKYPDDRWNISADERSKLESGSFAKQNNVVNIIDATGTNPLSNAISVGTKPCGLDSNKPLINKVFFRGRQVGEHLAHLSGIARWSISQLKVSRDGNHVSYVAMTDFDDNGGIGNRKYYAVLDGRRSPVVDEIGTTQLAADGSTLSFKGLQGNQIVEYVLAPSAPSGTATNAVKQQWDLDPIYASKMVRSIRKRWFPPRGHETKQVVVQFLMGQDGKIQKQQASPGSGVPSADRAAVQAVEDAAPFPPLPSGSPAWVWVRVELSYSGVRIISASP